MIPASSVAQGYQSFGPSGLWITVHAARGWMWLAINGKNFVVRADSERFAAWADSTQALAGRRTSARLAYFDSALDATQAMTFTRLSDESASRYEIVGEDGDQKGSITISSDSMRTIVDRLRGIGAYRAPSGPPVHAPGQPFLVFEVQRQAVPRPGYQRLPRYPETLREQHQDGEVLVQFVVDTAGHVDMSTLKFLHSNFQQFSNAVRDALLTERFFPAEYEGHIVRELIQQPFGFRAGR